MLEKFQQLKLLTLGPSTWVTHVNRAPPHRGTRRTQPGSQTLTTRCLPTLEMSTPERRLWRSIIALVFRSQDRPKLSDSIFLCPNLVYFALLTLFIYYRGLLWRSAIEARPTGLRKDINCKILPMLPLLSAVSLPFPLRLSNLVCCRFEGLFVFQLSFRYSTIISAQNLPARQSGLMSCYRDEFAGSRPPWISNVKFYFQLSPSAKRYPEMLITTVWLLTMKEGGRTNQGIDQECPFEINYW